MIATYPRLPAGPAAQLLAELTEVASGGSVQLRKRASTSHPLQIPYPTGPRQPANKLKYVAEGVRTVAEQCGYPAPLKGRHSSDQARRFDQIASVLLLDRLELAPADAGEEGVWSFLSLVVLPDVAFWRWPNVKERSDYERLLGRPRNVFRRLWWRAFCLGSDASAQLFEDEAVAIMERPTIGGDPRVARAVAGRQLRAAQDHPELSRTELLRDAAKRFRRFTTFLTLPSMTDSELDQLIDEVFSDAVAVMQASRRARVSTGGR